VHAPPEQSGVTWLVEQGSAHPPQAVAVVLMSVSQPSDWRLALQFARPAEQTPLHVPTPQVRVAIPLAEQTVPHAPQLSGSMLVSRHVPPHTESEPQETWQTAPEHTRPERHAVPHAPQWALSLRRLRSHPLAGIPSQSPKPSLHRATPQAPATQLAVALGIEHTRLHPPQLAALVLVLVSQPLATTPSQFPSPEEHAMEHTPPAQPGTPPVAEQRAPHAPQLFTSVRMTVSQPSPEVALQSRRSLGQLTLEVPHIDPAHTALVPMGGGGQATPQPPQLATSPDAVLTSQPSSALALQSRKPALHAPIAQRPPEQLDAALADWQRLPHTPQLLASEPVLVSQPLAAAPSQSAKPDAHAESTHAPIRHPATPLGKEHARPQAPQWPGSLARSRHTPEQAVVPPAQVEVQAPEEHTVPAPQSWPQAPQWRLSVCTLTHVPEHTRWPGEQVSRHAPSTQAWPPGQALPHAPQWRLSAPTLVSHPLATIPSQLP